jgi:hypothetical protein
MIEIGKIFDRSDLRGLRTTFAKKKNFSRIKYRKIFLKFKPWLRCINIFENL